MTRRRYQFFFLTSRQHSCPRRKVSEQVAVTTGGKPRMSLRSSGLRLLPLAALRQIDPTGKSLREIRNRFVQPLLKKYFAFAVGQNSNRNSAVSCSQGGRWPTSSTLGAGCGGREGVARRAHSHVRRNRVELTPRRWCQVCGNIRRRRWQTSPVTGVSTYKP